jgi:hypothetical protein
MFPGLSVISVVKWEEMREEGKIFAVLRGKRGRRERGKRRERRYQVWMS